MERTGYWLHKWTDETSAFDHHGRWSGGLDCYERDYSMWIPDRIRPDDTVAVNDYIDKQFELSSEVADGLEVIEAADAQATIAALQARVRELQSVADEKCRCFLERAEQAEQQLTQRTAERDTARRRVDELEAREVDVALLRGDLEKRTAELEAVTRERDEAAKDRDDWITSWRALQRYNERIEAELERVRAERDHAKKMEAIQKEVADNQTWHVQKLRTLIAALPKVEGEINERFCTGSYYSSPRDYRTHVTFEAALVALLKHRQGMEG